MIQQRTAGSLDNREDGLETVDSPVPRVGYIKIAVGARVKRTKHHDTPSLFGGLGVPLEDVVIASVHRQDDVVVVEVVSANGPGTVRDHHVVTCSNLAHAGIGVFALMVRRDARGINAVSTGEVAPGEQVVEYRLRKRTATDVPLTDKHDAGT